MHNYQVLNLVDHKGVHHITLLRRHIGVYTPTDVEYTRSLRPERAIG